MTPPSDVRAAELREALAPGAPPRHGDPTMLDERTFTTRTGTFHALFAGPEEAPLALCLHGFPDTARTFERLLVSLAQGGFRAVAPWLRGYAPSTLEGPFGIDALGHDAVAIADALSPGRPVAIVGHDWGAVAAYRASMLAPARFSAAVASAVPHPLALASNLLAMPRQLRRSWYMAFFQLPRAELLVARHDFALIDRLWRDWSPGFTPSAEHMADVKRCLAASMPAPLAHYRALRTELFRRDRARIRVPTLHLHGANDGCIGASLGRGQARWFDGPFESELLEGAGHFSHLEQPDLVERLVLGWASHWSRRRTAPLDGRSE